MQDANPERLGAAERAIKASSRINMRVNESDQEHEPFFEKEQREIIAQAIREAEEAALEEAAKCAENFSSEKNSLLIFVAKEIRRLME